MTEPLTAYPDEALCFSDDKPEFDEILSGHILQYFDDEDKGSNPEDCTIIIDDNKRYKALMKYAKKHQAQIYTMVDGDDGEVYWSKGVRYCNRINCGLYAVVKIDGLKVDNS